MTEIIAIVCPLGGTGRSTTAINVAACLADYGHKTLLIDTDPQGNSTRGLGLCPEKLQKSFAHFFWHGVGLEKVIRATSVANLHILPSNLDFYTVKHEFTEIMPPEALLKRRLSEALIDPSGQKFDFIVIDSPPGLGGLSISIMTAATHLLIPLQSEYLHLEALSDLLDIFKRIRKTSTPDLSILGFLVTMCRRPKDLRVICQNIKEELEPLVFKQAIYFDARLSEAFEHGLPIANYNPQARGARQYKSVTREILHRIGT